MKKNRTMRAAALLLALTLITSCFVGSTFAKYTTNDTATDTARVAEWGIEVLASGNLFGANYNPNDALDSVDDDVIGLVTTSVSGDGTKVVAPGTENAEGLTVKITGTPEVSYATTATADAGNKDIVLKVGHWGVLVAATGLNDATDITKYYVENGGEYKLATGTWTPGTYYEMHDSVQVDTNDYYPIVWKQSINDGSATELSNIATIMTDMAAAFEAKDGNANISPALSYKLTWEWPFDDGNNLEDTILGNLFAGNADAIVVYSADGITYTAAPADKYCLDISAGITVTVEQTN